MRIALVSRQPGRVEFGIIYGTIAVLALIAAMFLPVLDLAPSCAFKAITGLPCPTCGATRSVFHLAHGQIRTAFAMNPLIFTAFLLAVVLLLYDLFSLLFDLRRISIKFTEREQRLVRLLAVLLLASNWLYLVQSS